MGCEGLEAVVVDFLGGILDEGIVVRVVGEG